MPVLGFYVLTLRDYDNEASAVRFHCPTLNAGNFAAQDTLRGDLQNAILAITLGQPDLSEFGNHTRLAIGPAASNKAQRELKWKVSYRDTTTQRRYSLEIPTADPTFMDPNDRPNAHIGDGAEIDTFVGALEAFAKSDAGNAIVVDEVSLVGRRV